MKKVLVLGAGLVAKPLVDYLAKLDDTALTVVDIVPDKAAALTAEFDNAESLGFDASDGSALAALVQNHDFVVSLLPGGEHPKVANLCLALGKHMATASYVSPEMRAMDSDVKSKGLTFINECGVDPGMDHMSAMRIIHDAKDKGGQVVSFRSYCGGLPAPEANTNPLGYKFSWAPQGVLGAAVSPARYLHDGQIVDVPGDELFREPEIVDFPDVGKFEGYPNRDSTPYVDLYDIAEVKTLFRGTLRNTGHCASWYRWVKLGLFGSELREDLGEISYRQYMQGLIGDSDEPKAALAAKWNLPETASPIANLEWLGLFSDEKIGITTGANVDVLAKRMLEKCEYGDGERDMIVMQHEFVLRYPEGDKRMFSTLVEYGIPNGDSAMARTVALPLAIATRMTLEGTIDIRGVVTPVQPAIYNPILDELEALGISFDERVE